MIDKFGKVMVYVQHPRAVADFFINKIDFIELKVNRQETRILSVAVTPNRNSDTCIELFDKSVVQKMAPELNTDTPSICFSSYDIKEMRNKLISNRVNVGDIIEMAGALTFNFSDIEGNYFAVQEISRD